MPMLPPYMDQLDPERQQVFKELTAFSDQFVLAGGTALMLQIGHRLSFDFDCFCQEEVLPDTIDRKIKRIFGKVFIPVVRTREQVTFTTGHRIEVTFVSHPYPPLKKLIATDFIPLFHTDDLVANKAYTIGRRGAWRDYVDLFFFLKWKLYTLNIIIDHAKRKFENEFNEKLFLEQLVYFKDIDMVTTNFLKESYSNSDIQSFLEYEVEQYLKKVLG